MKELLKKLINPQIRKRIISLVFRIWYLFCRMLPLKNRVLFFSIRANGKLLDNAKAVYDELDCPKVVFAARVPHGIRDSIKAYYMLLTSRVIITDDYMRYAREFKFRKEQKIFQIWHACGAFKMFGLDAPSKLTKEQERATHAQYSAVAVTGEECRKFYAGAFGISEDICLPVGLPRTDRLFTEAESMKKSVYDRHPEFANKHIYLYCPTFRECDGERIEYDPKIDWDLLSASLEEDEIFIIRRHPIMNYKLFDGAYNNIYDLSDESTLELTAASDVIITDYSSVIYDACLLNVPTVFYCPDFKEYERGFYLKFPEDLPGILVTDGGKLLAAVRQTKEKPPVERIEQFKNRQLGACDGHATERTVEIIEGWLK
ncbi:MAG: CDP-glycerol glycerophosphotransferase family protein [Clostridia bacterium]|nr:CDP-glycerol glycerophosphotransferase family protein [Clostridia bacterium]